MSFVLIPVTEKPYEPFKEVFSFNQKHKKD